MTQIDEPNLEQEITNIFITIDNYGTAEEARVDIRKLIANQVEQARGCVDCKKLRCENCERLWQT